MKRLLLFTVILLTALHGFSEQTTKHSRVKVYASKNTHFEKLMKLGLSLESLESKKDAYFIGEFSAHDIERIKESGVEFEILIDDISAFYVNRNKGIDVDALNEALKSNKRNYNGVTTPSNFKLGSFGGYHNHNEMLAELDEMHSLFPDLISVKAPASTTTTIEGRPIYMVRISNNPEIDQDKPKVLYTGLIHAREPAGMQQMLFQMWYLLENYATNPEIEYLVNNLELFFIPCVNPDGYIHNQNTDPNGGGMWRKNKRMNAGGSVGVDLNRNFGYMWGYNNSGSSTDGNSMTYRGTSGFSEPETQVIKEVCESRAFSLALNNHTYSDILIYPFGYDNVLTPDSSIFIEYAKRMTQANGYAYGTCYQTLNYTSNGGSDDWFYGEQTTK
ncbi:MAG: M14 family metallopeptidase, partial [Salinivirgaceae bacterium]|nr:M14 family metallopeptidase [Salinivirgaceae bacterium]